MVERGGADLSVTRGGLARQLARIAVNTILAYATLGLALAALLMTASQVAPSVLGDFSVPDAWVYIMLWLLLAAPLTIGFVLVLDLALRYVPGRRLASLVLCAAPGATLACVSVFIPELRPIAAFLLVAGAMLGSVLRLPDSRRSPGSN